MQYTLQKLFIIQISTQQQVLRVNQMKTGRFESLNIFLQSLFATSLTVLSVFPLLATYL